MRCARVFAIALGAFASCASSTPARADGSVVGRSERNAFGRWEWIPLPRMATGIGISTHMFALGEVARSTGNHPAATANLPPIPGDFVRGNTVVAQTIDLKPLIVHLGGPLFIGPVFEIGPGFRSGSTNVSGYSASSAGVFFEGGLLPGLALPLGDSSMTLRLETLLGGRLFMFNGSADDQRAFSATSSHWVVQPRVALDMWTSPFVTVGAYGGANLLSRSDYVFGLSIAAHLSPFDATP